MTNKSKRTHPLDRDGDGAAGGSLPGNQTAPMATPPEATAPAEPSWIRDNAAILLKLAEAGIEIDTTKPAALTEETLADWTNEDAHAAEIFADQMTAEGSHMDEEGGDWLTADLNPIAIPAVLEPYLFRNVEQDDLADARATPGESAEKLDAIERETDEANAAATEPPFAIAARRWTADVPDDEVKAELNKRAALAWGEQGYVVEERLGDILVARAKQTDQPIITGPLRFAKGQDDIDPAHLMEAAVEVAIDYWGTAHYSVDMEGDDAVARLHEGEKPWDDHAPDTFDAEQVEAASTAGEGAVIAEEGETVADPATATASLDDGLVTIPTETAPVAVRLHELRILVTARRLYKSPEGYSSNYGAPYIDQATIDAWIAAGLAEDVPTAGNQGGVRVTAEARSVLNRAPASEAA